MKKNTAAIAVLLSLFMQVLFAQNVSKVNGGSTSAKPTSPNPGRAAANPKPAAEKKKPRVVHMQGKMPQHLFDKPAVKSK